ncbi:MAG: nucleoside kinase [Rikenellaceae bacterium]|nr:nucleoside kinase [Rikenellaceae bacterium]
MKDEKIKIQLVNDNQEHAVPFGTTLFEMIDMLGVKTARQPLTAYVDNQVRALNYRIFKPHQVEFLDITHFEGMRVYERTLFLVLHKAVADLFEGCRLSVKHSVSKGYYCEIIGRPNLFPADIIAIKRRADEIIAADMRIVKERMPRAEAEALYTSLGYDDKVALMRTRPHLYENVYRIDNMVGYFYGAVAPSTGYIELYDVRPYDGEGFYVAVPRRTNPDELEVMVRQEKMFDVFSEYTDWVNIMGVPNVGSLNSRILQNQMGELIKIGEAFHEKTLARIADMIAEVNRKHGAKLVLIAGPSSSGKTTTAKRLGIQLRVLGLHPVLISLDDYFVEREKTPLDENGDYDYEAFDAIDRATFNDHLLRLYAGDSVDIPRYDFITGKRQWHPEPLRLDDRSVLVVEGIHALNPELTTSIADDKKFKIYASALTSVAMDNLSRIRTTDNRLIRRIVRDCYTRGSDATATLQRWQSVRRGEDKHIFPYQEYADAVFNSVLFYEIPILKRFVEPMLRSVPDTVPEYAEACRLLEFLDNFVSASPEEVPLNSILREFIGGSSFKY